jgi:hypothetical protein
MSNTNDFLPFCATDTGTNLIEQSAWVASAARPIGNQPGIASSAFNNKALRQGTYVVSQLAQYISNFSNVSTLDNATPAQLLSQIMATFQPIAPTLTALLSGTGTWNPSFVFFIVSGNATAGATYTNNSVTYTVTATISAGLVLSTTGNGAPTAGGGTLTKTSGTGDATITFYAFRTSLQVRVRMVGGGGGGGGGDLGSAGGGTGGSGTASTFGSQMVADGGGGGASVQGGAPGGGTTLGTGPVGIAIPGSYGAIGSNYNAQPTYAGNGGNSPFGGAGTGDGAGSNTGTAGATNSGSGGGGGSGTNSSVSEAGGGGAAGGYVDAVVPSASYAYSVGTGGAGGAHGSGGGTNGAAGGSGIILVQEIFQ